MHRDGKCIEEAKDDFDDTEELLKIIKQAENSCKVYKQDSKLQKKSLKIIKKTSLQIKKKKCTKEILFDEKAICSKERKKINKIIKGRSS